MKLGFMALGALLALGVAAPAAAQDVATADALFHRGLEAMEAGRYAEACAALAESHRLDPRPGALFTLAECRSKEKKIATALALYDDYLSAFAGLSQADQARQRGREKIAAERKRALGPRIPRLVLRLPQGVSASVTRDDVALHAPALGVPLPVDPGEHHITTQVGGGAVHRQTIVIGLDEEKIVDLEVTTSKGDAPATAALPPAGAPPAPESPPPSGGSHRPFAFASVALGAVGLVVGAATGAVVLTKRGVVGTQCVNLVCSPAGLDAVNSAKTLGGVSTGGFVVGGIGAVAAAVLLLTDRPASGAAPRGGVWRPTVGSVDGRGAFLGARKEW